MKTKNNADQLRKQRDELASLFRQLLATAATSAADGTRIIVLPQPIYTGTLECIAILTSNEDDDVLPS